MELIIITTPFLLLFWTFDFFLPKGTKTYRLQFQIMVAFYDGRNKDIFIATRPKSKVRPILPLVPREAEIFMTIKKKLGLRLESREDILELRL